ncbi:hypothetical protein Q5752_003566 [Cryptotrichosporon argae]
MSASMTTRPRRGPPLGSIQTAPLSPDGKPRRRDSNTYLPSAYRRAPSSGLRQRAAGLWRRTRKRTAALVVAVVAALVALAWWVRTYEVQLELAVFSRRWAADAFDTAPPLAGCWDPANISPAYNLSRHAGPRRHLLAPGIALRRGMSCYDFAGTIGDVADVSVGAGADGEAGDENAETVVYHTYWRADLKPFGPRQADTLTAFLATQPLARSRLVVWSNDAHELARDPHLVPLLAAWPAHIEVRQVDMLALTAGTALDGLLGGADVFDERAWVDGDAVRLLALWHYGGVWLDMDMVLTRDLHTLLESEWVTQWDCYDKPYFALNGALMHFHRASPYLCEAFHLMTSSPAPAPNSFGWGSHLYARLHAALVAAHVRPFAVLPWCFADPRNCRNDIRFPDPYEPDPRWWGGRPWRSSQDGQDGKSGDKLLQEKLGMVFSVHTHNQWDKSWAKGGWMRRLMDRYEARVAELRGAHGSGATEHEGSQ